MAVPTSKVGKITKADFFEHASAINSLLVSTGANVLGTFNNPITDPNANRPSSLTYVVWDTATDPINWQNGDFNLRLGN